MKKLNKQLIAGITLGAVLLTGSIGAYAATNDKSHSPKECFAERDGQPPKFNKEDFAKSIAENFGVDKNDVLKAIENKEDFKDIGHAAMLAKISGKSFNEILAMKTNWRDVENTLGIDQKAIKKERDAALAERIAKNDNIDKETAIKLLADGYNPRDIEAAAAIAKAAGTDVQTVLDAKKINNRWHEVAASFGVNEDLLKSQRRDGFRGDDQRPDDIDD